MLYFIDFRIRFLTEGCLIVIQSLEKAVINKKIKKIKSLCRAFLSRPERESGGGDGVKHSYWCVVLLDKNLLAWSSHIQYIIFKSIFFIFPLSTIVLPFLKNVNFYLQIKSWNRISFIMWELSLLSAVVQSGRFVAFSITLHK